MVVDKGSWLAVAGREMVGIDFDFEGDMEAVENIGRPVEGEGIDFGVGIEEVDRSRAGEVLDYSRVAEEGRNNWAKGGIEDGRLEGHSLAEEGIVLDFEEGNVVVVGRRRHNNLDWTSCLGWRNCR